MEGELCFRGNYLQLVRSKKISNKQFKIIKKDVDLTMTVDYYLALVGRAK